MRIEQLEYIAAVTEHGSLRRASERLHISQPALSEAVSKLERELGVTLLDRRRSGARISRRGRELLQNMVEVLEAVERLRTAAGDETLGPHVVRVGTVSAATSTLLVPAVRELRAAHPGTTVEVVNTQQAEIHQGLRDRTRPAVRPTLLRLRLIGSYLRLLPRMLQRRREVGRTGAIGRRTLEQRWLIPHSEHAADDAVTPRP